MSAKRQQHHDDDVELGTQQKEQFLFVPHRAFNEMCTHFSHSVFLSFTVQIKYKYLCQIALYRRWKRIK